MRRGGRAKGGPALEEGGEGSAPGTPPTDAPPPAPPPPPPRLARMLCSWASCAELPSAASPEVEVEAAAGAGAGAGAGAAEVEGAADDMKTSSAGAGLRGWKRGGRGRRSCQRGGPCGEHELVAPRAASRSAGRSEPLSLSCASRRVLETTALTRREQASEVGLQHEGERVLRGRERGARVETRRARGERRLTPRRPWRRCRRPRRACLRR